MSRFLSFDVASISLGVADITIDTYILHKLDIVCKHMYKLIYSQVQQWPQQATEFVQALHSDANLRASWNVLVTLVDEIMAGFIIIHRADVFDSVGNGQTMHSMSTQARNRNMRKYLQTKVRTNEHLHTHVLIEEQPRRVGAFGGNKSNAEVEAALMYEFSDYASVTLVSPKRKNKICLGENLDLATFVRKCSSEYAARKAHTRANMYHLLSAFDLMHAIAHIPKSYHDDIADAIVQAIMFSLC